MTMDNNNDKNRSSSSTEEQQHHEEYDYYNNKDNESIYSTTSSMFSTSSRMSKINGAVKSSLKNLVRRKHRSSEQSSSTTITTTTKRPSINFSNLLNKTKKKDTSSLAAVVEDQQQTMIIPTSTTSSTLFGGGSLLSLSKTKRRNSIINLASRFLSSNPTTTNINNKNKSSDGISTQITTTISTEQQQQQQQLTTTTKEVGKLLFGQQVNDLEFFVHHEHVDSDSKSEKVTPVKKEEPWIRQRAKSVQENNNKAPMLHQLANKGSIINNNTIQQHQDLTSSPLLFKGLVTTTLTTLHTRLLNECDKTLSMILMSTNPSKMNYQEQLNLILTDLYKMTEMVNWDNELVIKQEIKQQITMIKKTKQQEEDMKQVKEIISIIKQIMNQCICQYYKQVEEAIIIPSKGYKIEGSNKYSIITTTTTTTTEQLPIDYKKTITKIDHMDMDAYWYRNYFSSNNNIHHFFGYNNDQDPILISIQVEENKEIAITNRQYRIIYRSKKQSTDQRRIVLDSFLLNAPNTVTPTSSIIPDTTWKSIIETNFVNIPHHNLLKMNHDLMISSGLHDELLRLDENSLHTKYKFGVLLVKQGQTREEEWFSNESTEAFTDFLNIIGYKIELKGYDGWAAGLDTKSGDSGIYSYVNSWNENQIAYHVSTLIPSKPGDKQQIQRKRHIGNDIVCVVFIENGNQPFNPAALKSQFLHVFIVVTKLDICCWKVEVVTVKDVPTFGPTLPLNGLFYNAKELESFIVTKLINAEYAAFKSPKFALPMNRAREGIFTNLVEKGYKLLLAQQQQQQQQQLLLLQQQQQQNEEQQQDETTISNSYSTCTSLSSSYSTNSTTSSNTISSPQPKKLLFHTKSASTSSSSSSSCNTSQQQQQQQQQHLNIMIPSPSKSNAIIQFSEGIVHGISRRRSAQELASFSSSSSLTTASIKKSSFSSSIIHHNKKQQQKNDQVLSSSKLTTTTTTTKTSSDSSNTTTTSDKNSTNSTALTLKNRLFTSIPGFNNN